MKITIYEFNFSVKFGMILFRKKVALDILKFFFLERKSKKYIESLFTNPFTIRPRQIKHVFLLKSLLNCKCAFEMSITLHKISFKNFFFQLHHLLKLTNSLSFACFLLIYFFCINTVSLRKLYFFMYCINWLNLFPYLHIFYILKGEKVKKQCLVFELI